MILRIITIIFFENDFNHLPRCKTCYVKFIDSFPACKLKADKWCTQQNVLKSQRKTCFYCLYLMIYDRHNCIFWDIRQRDRGRSWWILCSTLMAKVTDYSNVMSPSFSVMNHFLVYFLLTLLNITRQRHRLFYYV